MHNIMKSFMNVLQVIQAYTYSIHISWNLNIIELHKGKAVVMHILNVKCIVDML